MGRSLFAWAVRGGNSARKHTIHLTFFTAILLAGVGLLLAPVRPVNAESLSGQLDTCDPTFSRPSSTSSLSGVGTATYYEWQAFTVSATGLYTLEMSSSSIIDDDGVASIYQSVFNPASPLTNILFYNDDTGPGFLPAFVNVSLTAGTSYILVSTTFENGITGTYSWTLSGVGNFTLGANSITFGCPTTQTPTSTPTATPTGTPTETPSSTPTDTPTSTSTETPSSTPTETPTGTPTDTPTSTPTDTPTDVPTSTPTDTPTDVASSTPTDTPTATPTALSADTATATSTPSHTAAATEMSAATATTAPSLTASVTLVPPEPRCDNPLPAGSVQGRMVLPTLALYDPNPNATTDILIPGGTSWWVIDAASGYYRIWIACQANPVWVPSLLMTPNSDDVWSGQPLPDANVANS